MNKLNWRVFLTFIQGNANNTDLDHRVFNVACFCCSLVNLLSIFTYFFIQTNIYNLILPICGTVGYAILFSISRLLTNHKILHSAFVIITQLYISICWFFNAGSEGVMPIVLLGVFVMYLASTSYKQYLGIILFVLLNIFILHYIEYYNSDWVVYYPTRESRYADLQFMYSIILVGLGICIYYYKKAFEDERDRNERNSLILAESKNELKIKKIVENSTDAVITTDASGIVLEWNKSAYKLFSLDAQFAKGKQISELIIPIGVQENFANAINYFKEKTNFIRFETSAIGENGLVFPIELSMTQIEYEEKVLLNFFIRDIKERKENEEKILRKNKQLNELNEEMDAFIYRSSHDLRTPIINISGLVDLYHDSNLEEKEEIIAKTKLNVDRLIKILDDLSNYSKNHRNEVAQKLIRFDEILDEVKEKLALLPQYEKLKINITEIGNYEFISDADRLKVVIFNILENSIIFRDTSKEYILVDVLLEKHGSKIIIRIKDNGEGIKPESISKIFNMFFRASVRSSGSGLGLYIAKRIITKLNGSIEVFSQKGVGTEFVIELPNNHEGVIMANTVISNLTLSLV